MSRIGKQIITIPAGVTVTQNDGIVIVTGPKGTLNLNVPDRITVEIKDNEIKVARVSEDKKVKANHGTTRAHINNMILGVQNHWVKEMEIRGTGYKFAVSGNKLTVTAGYIHPVVITAPEGVAFQVAEDSKLTISGANKEVVGQVASNIRKIRKPEPYKGKGIRYLNEFIKLKAGKTAKA
ncbi:MAG TPA: 50S ribosomal protein L6 [Patescibacteria group bacterium]